MFANLKLSSKILFTFVPLFILLIVGTYYLNTSGQETAMLEQAKKAAFNKAHIVRVSLVQQMLENEMVDDAYLESLTKVGGLEDLYIRIKPDQLRLREWLEDSTRAERLDRRMKEAMGKGTIGDDVFRTGQSLFVSREENIEAIIPFKAEKKCQACHDVSVNHVLGVAHVTIPMKDIQAAIAETSMQTAYITIGFTLITLVVGYFMYRSLIQKRLTALVVATEALGQGNLNHELPAPGSDDELGFLMKSFDRMRRALKQSQDALRTSTVGMIAQSLIRDFRAPMRHILAAVDQVEKGNPDAQARAELTAKAKASVLDMNRMAQDLLDYTTGDQKVNKQQANVAGILSYVAEAVKADLDRDTVTLEVHNEFSGSAPLDYERLGRALINIISYAVNYIPPGGKMRLSTAHENTELVIRVADNGNGIPPQFRDKIFEPFTKLVQEKGLGLALALAKRIIEAQGGNVSVKSEEGTGTTFVIRMPLN